MEDHDEIEVEAKVLAIGDAVIVHWKIVENVKVATGVFPDKPQSFDDPIISVDGSRQTSVDGDTKEVGGSGDGINTRPDSQ